MVSTRRSSFSVPSLPSTSLKGGRPLTPIKSTRRTVVASASPAKRKNQQLAAASSTRKRETPPLPPRPPSRQGSSKQKKQEAAASTNFLQDFNLESCSDLLSLPDPPSPSKRRQRRSLSSASPLQDLTNSNSSDFSNNRQARKRMSLGHVPSPVVTASSQTLDLFGVTGSVPQQHHLKPPRGPRQSHARSGTPLLLPSIDLSGAPIFKRKSRQSLSHVPSPVVVLKNLEASLDPPGAVIRDILSTTKASSVPKKRRQSIGHVLLSSQEEVNQATTASANTTTGDATTSDDAGRNMVERDNSGEATKLDFSGVSGSFDGDETRHKKKRQSFFYPSEGGELNADVNDVNVALEESKPRKKKRQSFFVHNKEEITVSEKATSSDETEVTEEETILDFSGVLMASADDGGIPATSALAAAPEGNTEESMPFDFTGAMEDEENSAEEEAAVVSTKKNKKKRQSFFVPQDEDDNATSNSQTLEEQLDLANDLEQSVGKRRKKRQSILLPCDANQGERSDITDYFEKLAKYGGAEIKEPESVVAEIADESDAVIDKMTAIRQLVRSYCSHPQGERGSSDAAQELQDLTGYPLVPRPKLPRSKTSQEAFSRKQALFSELGPIVECMDKGKEEERKFYERETGYRAEKRRSGRYRYFSMTTNQRITPLEYEEIYLPILEQTSVEKSVGIKQFLQEFDKDVWAEKHQGGEECEDEDKVVAEIVETGEEHDVDENKDDNMDIDDESPGEATVEDSHEEEGTEEVDIEVVTLPANAAPRQVLLPLPPRDKVSSDPDIAEAHKKLWTTIDNAVETYSRTVLAIEAAKEFAESL